MTDEVQIWLFAGGFGLIATLFVLQWTHMRHCKMVGETLVRLDQTMKDLKELLGPELVRLRDASHDNKNAILAMDGRVKVLEERTHRGNHV